MMKDRIIVLTPPSHLLGGVALHYAGLKSYWSKRVEYFETVKSSSSSASKYFKLALNLLKFFITLVVRNPKGVVINVSVKPGLYSKNAYLSISRIFGKKAVAFIHGWDEDKEYMLEDSRAKGILSCEGFIVLAHRFKEHLSKFVPAEKIFLATTKVDDRMVKDFDNSHRTGQVRSILFLSRVEKEKGVFIVLDAYQQLLEKYPGLWLSIVGDGDALPEVKRIVAEKGLSQVSLPGRVSGEALQEAFKAADVFLLPTHGEGIPAALLEAMAFGLPVITRPVGGIPDFFKNGEMGWMTESLDPTVYSGLVGQLIEYPELTLEFSRNNYRYAKDHFMASAVAKKTEEIFNHILS